MRIDCKLAYLTVVPNSTCLDTTDSPKAFGQVYDGLSLRGIIERKYKCLGNCVRDLLNPFHIQRQIGLQLCDPHSQV